MDFSGTQTIAEPIDKVWAFLVDVNNVAVCAPGFQSLEVLGEEHWKANVGVGIGSFKAKFVVDVTRLEMHELEQMVMKARGKAPGSAVDMSGNLQFVSLDDALTRVDWQANVVVSGTITSVGTRLLRGTAERITKQFFACLFTKLRVPE